MKKLVRYFFVGGIAALVDLSLFAALLYSETVAWFMAAIISFLVATGVNYALSIRHVFESGIRFGRRDEMLLVFIASGVGLAINQLVLFLSISRLAIFPLLAKVCATGVVFIWNFLARRYYIFRT